MDVHTLHNLLILFHAAAGTISFFAGGYLIFSPKFASNHRLFGLYWWSLVGLVVFLAGAMFVYWTEYSSTERIIFPGLFVLGLYMLYRARNARRLMKDQENSWRQDYIEHIGFTLISLFEGFIIVGALNSGFPGWLVAILAILGVLLGRAAIGFAQRRVA
jgi:hypothetical protein